MTRALFMAVIKKIYVYHKEVSQANVVYLKIGIIIERRGEFTYLKFDDVKVKWSDDSANIFVTVQEQYVKKVNGLCGNYNQEKASDFQLTDGSTTSISSIFVNNWRIDSGVS
jgi:hypothetical protein